MQVKEFTVKKVVTTKGELVSIGEWESFVMYYAIDKQGMLDCPDDQTFVIDPSEAAIFNLLPHGEAVKLEDFYRNQLGE